MVTLKYLKQYRKIIEEKKNDPTAFSPTQTILIFWCISFPIFIPSYYNCILYMHTTSYHFFTNPNIFLHHNIFTINNMFNGYIIFKRKDIIQCLSLLAYFPDVFSISLPYQWYGKIYQWYVFSIPVSLA